MSFIHRDMLTPAVALMSARQAAFNKFDRAFPRHHVYTHCYGYLVYYTSWSGIIESDVLKEFVVSVGIDWEEFRTQKVDSEVSQLTFYISPGFQWDGTTGFDGTYKDHDGPDTPEYDPTPALDSPSRDDISNTINDVFVEGDEVSITISYGGGLKRYIDEHELPWVATGGEVVAGGFNSEIVEDILLSNPWYFIANSRHKPYVKNSNEFQTYNAGLPEVPLQPYNNGAIKPAARNSPLTTCSIVLDGYEEPAGGAEAKKIELGLFALMSQGSEWEPILTKEGSRVWNRETTTTTTAREEGEALRHTFTLKYKFVKTRPTSSYIYEMRDWYDDYYQNLDDIPYNPQEDSDKYGELETTSTIDTLMKESLFSLMTDSTEGTNSLFDGTFLRVDAARKMKKDAFARLISQHLKTDTRMKSSTFLEKAFAVVTVIVGVALVIFGAFLTIITKGMFPPSYMLMSAGIGIMSAGQVILSEFGGGSASGLIKRIGVFAQYSGYLSMAIGMYGAWQQVREAAINAAIENEEARMLANLTSGAVESGVSTIDDSVILAAENMSTLDVIKFYVNTAVDSAINSVKSLFTEGGTSLTTKEVLSYASDGFNYVSKGVDYLDDKEARKLESKTRIIDAELNRLSEASDSRRRMASASYQLSNSIEEMSTYDAISYLDKQWILNNSPQTFFDEFHAERTIA